MRSAVGSVSSGTKAELRYGKKSITNPKAPVPSGVFANSPKNIEDRYVITTAYSNKICTITNYSVNVDFGVNPRRIAAKMDTVAEIMLRKTDAITCPVITADLSFYFHL